MSRQWPSKLGVGVQAGIGSSNTGQLYHDGKWESPVENQPESQWKCVPGSQKLLSYKQDKLPVDKPIKLPFGVEFVPKEFFEKRETSAFDPEIGDLFALSVVTTLYDLQKDLDPREFVLYCVGHSSFVVAALDGPSHRTVFTYDLKLPIKHVAWQQLVGYRHGDSFAVVTAESVSLFRINNSADGYTVQEVFSVPGYMRASFNPWNVDQCAFVDSTGNWAVYEKDKMKIEGTIFDPTELSKWHGVSWSASDRLLVMNRSKIVEANLTLELEKDLVEAKTWSKILQWRRVNESLTLLLTSQELTVLENMTRVVAWKHYLVDPSLKLTWSIDGDTVTIMVFPRYGKCQVYELGLGHRVSLSEPYFMEHETGNINMLQKYENALFSYTYEKKFYVSKITEHRIRNVVAKEKPREILNKSFFSLDLANLKPLVFHLPTKVVDPDDVVFQQYAQAFSQISLQQSLFELCQPSGMLESVEELQSLVEQFVEHCRQDGYNFTGNMIDFNKLFKELHSIWGYESKELVKVIARDVGLQSYTFNPPVTDAEVPAKVAEILGKWEDEDAAPVEQEPVAVTQVTQEVAPPTIKSSQIVSQASQSQRKKKKKRIGGFG